jgi:indolepyruvate ferredoxin oxidoreductase alpha subunit
MSVDHQACINCNICIRDTGCMALLPGDKRVSIDPVACNGCSICAQVCPKKAIIKKEVQK